MAKVYDLLVRARGDTRQAQAELRRLRNSVRGMGRGMQTAGRSMMLGITAPIVALAGVGVKEANETRLATMQTEAVIKSMGKSMKVTKSQVLELAQSLQNYSGVESDIIQSNENIALSFSALASNPKLFKQTMRAAIDMSAALKQDVQTSVVQLGKAMQNGAKGAGALAKNGTLAKDDIAKLQEMAKRGEPMWRQQAFILEAVNKQYQGQGKNIDPMKRLALAVKDIAESFGVLLLPFLERASKFFQRFAEKIQSLDPHTKKLIGAFALIAAAIGPVVFAAGTLLTTIAGMSTLLAGLGTSLAVVSGIGAAIIAVGAALVVAWKTSAKFRESVTKSFESIKASLGALKASFDGALGGSGSTMRLLGEGIKLVAKIFGSVVAGMLQKFAVILATATGVVTGIVQIFRGDFKHGIATVFKSLAGIAEIAMLTVVEKITAVMGKLPGKLGAPFRAANKKIRDELDATQARLDGMNTRNAANEARKLSDAFSDVARNVQSAFERMVTAQKEAAKAPSRAAGKSGRMLRSGRGGGGALGFLGPVDILGQVTGALTAKNSGSLIDFAAASRNPTEVFLARRVAKNKSLFSAKVKERLRIARQLRQRLSAKQRKALRERLAQIGVELMALADEIAADMAAMGEPGNGLTAEQEAELAQSEDASVSSSSDGGGADSSASLSAALAAAQGNAVAANASLAAFTSSGDIGTGLGGSAWASARMGSPVVVNITSAVPYTQDQAAQVGDMVAAALQGGTTAGSGALRSNTKLALKV